MEPSLSIPSFQFTGNTEFSIQLDPIAQLSNEFDLKEINDVQSRIFLKKNGLPNERHRLMVDNRIRLHARQLLLTLQNLKSLGATADQLRQTGLESLRKLETTSMMMIHDFERFQAGSIELERWYSEFDAKAAVSTSSFNFTAFSESPVQNPLMGAIGKYKTQIVQCIQMEDPETPGIAGVCIAQQLKGLSDAEQKAVLDFVPNAVVGKAINQAAAIPAVASKVISAVANLAVKIMVKGAIVEAAVEAPHMHDDLMKLEKALDGEDPIFNKHVKHVTQEIKDAAPEWVKSVGRSIVNGNRRLMEVDQELHEKYGTIPGIVHQGVVGSFEVAATFAPVSLAKSAVSAVKEASQLAKGILHTVENLAKLHINPLQPVPVFSTRPVARGNNLLVNFFKDEFGGGKLPIDRDFIIDLFKKIGYKEVPGGKGSHKKLVKPNSEVVIIPRGKNGQLPRGTVGSLMRTYDEAVKKEMVNSAMSPSKPTPTVNNYAYTKPFPHRIDYSKGYLQSTIDYVAPKEFNGVLKRDLLVVQYHSSAPLGVERTYKWFMPVCQGNKLCTVEEVQHAIAKLTSYGEISHAALARIPAGEPVRFLHGKAIGKYDPITQELLSGGGIQYRFFDFDPNWIIKTRKME